MVDFPALKEQAFKILLSSGRACFLRNNTADSSLWLSDLPRRTSLLSDTEERLQAQGFTCSLCIKSSLWLIDLSPKHYESLACALPTSAPKFPSDDAMLPAYSLCRLLMSHPAALEKQPFEFNRRLIKMIAFSDYTQSFTSLHEQCSSLLRQKKTLPYLGGQLLSAWLSQKGES